MRRRYLLALGTLLAVVLALLALGALPGLLGGGERSYVTATPVDEGELDAGSDGELTPIRVENLSENRFPYTHEAVADGVSDPYEDDRFGIKATFTHTPEDEFGELRLWEENATVDDAVVVAENGSYYRLEITTDPNDD